MAGIGSVRCKIRCCSNTKIGTLVSAAPVSSADTLPDPWELQHKMGNAWVRYDIKYNPARGRSEPAARTRDNLNKSQHLRNASTKLKYRLIFDVMPVPGCGNLGQYSDRCLCCSHNTINIWSLLVTSITHSNAEHERYNYIPWTKIFWNLVASIKSITKISIPSFVPQQTMFPWITHTYIRTLTQNQPIASDRKTNWEIQPKVTSNSARQTSALILIRKSRHGKVGAKQIQFHSTQPRKLTNTNC